MFVHAQDWKVQPASHWNLVNIVSAARKRGNNCRGSKMFLKTFRNIFASREANFSSATNVACARKRGNVSGNNVSTMMFPQQCFLVCGGLKMLKYFEHRSA